MTSVEIAIKFLRAAKNRELLNQTESDLGVYSSAAVVQIARALTDANDTFCYMKCKSKEKYEACAKTWLDIHGIKGVNDD